MRKTALRFAEGNSGPVTVKPEDLSEMLGPEIFTQDQFRKNLPAGVATGLAWTETGGDVLYIEATALPNGKGLTLTGQLGEVMKESAQAAQSFVWSHAAELGIDPERFKDTGIHVHVPAGAIPKDGPSAGITMAVALTSVYTGQPVAERHGDDRRDHADRPRVADRRRQGEGPGRPACGHEEGRPAGAQPEGPPRVA